MQRHLASIFALALVCSSPVLVCGQQAHFDGNSWWRYVKVLAADDMEGRETGSAGLSRAQAFVVDQLKQNGVEPAGTNGYYQTVHFVSRQLVEKDSRLALVYPGTTLGQGKDGHTVPLQLGEDAIFSTRVDLAPVLTANLVFAGYGLSIPEMNYDDLAGLNLTGKIAVIFAGSPANIPGALSSHYQSASERWKALHKAGAVGVITILNPFSMDIPWPRMAANRNHPSMALADKEFDETPGQKLAVAFNPAHAEMLFDSSGHKFQEILDLAKDRKPLPRFPLAPSIKARTSMNTKKVESANLVAKVPGSDPKLKNEYVVLSAHIDHIGIGEPINGDRIYNGAMDNASGSAVLLDVAASLKKSPEKLKRSLLFVFVTGEEKGLLGSRYFSVHPTVKPNSMVADVNIDMFLPIVPLKVLTVYGMNESDLADLATEVAQPLGIATQPDPEPLRNSFIRSDQYSFIRQGIPSLAMKVGFVLGAPEQKTFKDWLTLRYHAPSDDLNQPVDLPAAAAYEEVIRGLLIRTANQEQRPRWKNDSFFRRYAQASGGF